MDTNTLQILQSTSDKIGTNITSIFSSLADKAGVAVDHFWPIFIWQQVIQATTYLFIALILFIFCFSLLKHFNKKINILINLAEDGRYVSSDTKENFYIGYLASMLGMVISIMILVVNFNTIITGFFNPEYAAIAELVKMVK